MSNSRNLADLASNDVIDTSATGVDITGTVTADGLTVDGTTAFSGTVDYTDINSDNSHLPGHYYHNRSAYSNNVYVHYYNNKEETIGNTYLRFKAPSGFTALWHDVSTEKLKYDNTFEAITLSTGTYQVNGTTVIDSNAAASFFDLTLNTGNNISWGGSYASGKPTIAAAGENAAGIVVVYPTGNYNGEVARFDTTGMNLNRGGYRIKGTTVIDSTSNLANINNTSIAGDKVRVNAYTSGTDITSGQIEFRTDGKTGWGVGDEFGKIRFYCSDGSGIGARDAAEIRAVNNVGNGSNTTTFEGELEFYTSPYNGQKSLAMRLGGGKEVELFNHLYMNGSIAIDSNRNLNVGNITAANINLGANPALDWSSNNITLKSRDAIGVVKIAGNGTYSSRIDITDAANTTTVGTIDPNASSFLNGDFNLPTGALLVNGTTVINNSRQFFPEQVNYVTPGYGTLYTRGFSFSMGGSTGYRIRLRGFGSGIVKIKAFASHWTHPYNLIRESYCHADSYHQLSEDIIVNVSSPQQGAWTFYRPDTGEEGYQTDLIIEKSAGSYGGGMTGMITIEGQRNLYLQSFGTL